MAGYYAGVPPFSGAPPLPAGAKIPVPHWNGGHWIPNPHFNPLAPPRPGPAWMPSHAWHLPPPVNPYKRQPRQPSAEYLAHKLSDNPLGLSNMIPVEQLEREKQAQAEAATTSTPWIWNPRTLDTDTDPPVPESYTSKGTLQPTFSTNIVRTPEYYALPRHPTHAPHPSHLLQRHNSMPVVESHVLSPLVFPHPHTRQSLVRHTTLPANLTTTTTTLPHASSSSSSSSSSPNPTPTPPSSHHHHHHHHPRSIPNNPEKKRRKGFWNRRGDHVTPNGYIVYAPGSLVYPTDLDDYPDGKDAGYQNEIGVKAAWAPRPELIPKDGYQSLIEWVTNKS
ncbi:hypothetical protein Ac2012v2_006996 [Leucoagaricus gongylophorus]